jgi:hypothetical protein
LNVLDGVQTPDPDAVSLVDAVRPLHQAGVRIFAIGVGGHYRRSELLQLVERPSDVYEAADFDELLRLVKRIARGTCAPAPGKEKKQFYSNKLRDNLLDKLRDNLLDKLRDHFCDKLHDHFCDKFS